MRSFRLGGVLWSLGLGFVRIWCFGVVWWDWLTLGWGVVGVVAGFGGFCGFGWGALECVVLPLNLGLGDGVNFGFGEVWRVDII